MLRYLMLVVLTHCSN